MRRTLEVAEYRQAPWGRLILSGAFCSLETAASGSLPTEPLVNTAHGTFPAPLTRDCILSSALCQKLSSHRRINSDNARTHQAGWWHELPEHEAWWAGPPRAGARKPGWGRPRPPASSETPVGRLLSDQRHPVTSQERSFHLWPFMSPLTLKSRGSHIYRSLWICNVQNGEIYRDRSRLVVA